jgi:hypothetical protein
MHAVSPMHTRLWRTSRHGAAKVPRQPHVQTRLWAGSVPDPSILPCTFPRPNGTGLWCPDGAASRAACRPTSASHACGMAHSGQSICTLERTQTCAKKCPELALKRYGGCRVKRGANAFKLHAQ